MNRTHIRWLPIVAAGLFFAYQYFTSEKFVNPETGRKSHVALSTQQESQLGLESYQQILSQSPAANSGADFERVQRVMQHLVGASGAVLSLMTTFATVPTGATMPAASSAKMP